MDHHTGYPGPSAEAPATTTYLSLHVEVPLRTALAAFEDLFVDAHGNVRICPAPRVTLVARARDVHRVEVPRRSTEYGYVTYLCARGAFSIAGLRRGVELELTPWSAHRSELGLRTRGRWPWSSHQALDHGYHLLRHVRTLVREWADTPLRTMTTPTVGGAGKVLGTPDLRRTRCYLLLQTDPGSATEVTRRAREHPAVIDASATTGSYDVFVRASGSADDMRVLPEALRALPGVSRVVICLPQT